MREITRRNMGVAAGLALLAMLSTNMSDRASAGNRCRGGVDAEKLASGGKGYSELVANAAAVLVFPSVIKAGMGIGGEYGEGVLLARGRPVEYYNTAGASVGFQLGVQSRSMIIVFMTEEALAGFQRVDGWKVGVDGSVALINVGVGGSVDTSRIGSPIVGFVFDGKGLMYNLTLEGTKISRMSR